MSRCCIINEPSIWTWSESLKHHGYWPVGLIRHTSVQQFHQFLWSVIWNEATTQSAPMKQPVNLSNCNTQIISDGRRRKIQTSDCQETNSKSDCLVKTVLLDLSFLFLFLFFGSRNLTVTFFWTVRWTWLMLSLIRHFLNKNKTCFDFVFCSLWLRERLCG